MRQVDRRVGSEAGQPVSWLPSRLAWQGQKAGRTSYKRNKRVDSGRRVEVLLSSSHMSEEMCENEDR